MANPKELSYEALQIGCNAQTLPFRTTAEVAPLEGIIGQERAVEAFDFGLAVKMKGYNIYMSGPSGTGKTTYALQGAKRQAQKEPVPYDWCYVYNFKNPRCPLSLRFAPGEGKAFREDMAELVQLFRTELQKAFRSEDYERQKNELIHSFDDAREDLMKQMNAVAEQFSFQVKTTNSGIYFMPVVDGKTVGEEEYEALTEEQKNTIEDNSAQVQEKAGSIMREIRDLDRQSQKKNDELDYKVGLFAIGHHVNAVQEKYLAYERVVSFLNDVQEDVLENISQFLGEEEESDDALAGLLPMFAKKNTEDVTLKYNVNLIVDNSCCEGAPVVVTFNPTYYNLMGEVEYDSEFGNLTTDFMKIKGGLLHKANGGYLIVQAQELLTAPQGWEALRRVIKTGEISMDAMRDQIGTVLAPTLKPEPIPANIKVILIGSPYYYDLLSEYDEEFHKLFKIKAEFDYEMPLNMENTMKLAGFIKGFTQREKTADFTAEAVLAVLQFAARSAERKDKLSTRFNKLAEVLGEAATWSRLEGAELVEERHVRKAIAKKAERLRLYEEKMNEMLDEEVIMIDTQGMEIGQINGLAVLELDEYAFGNPSRITATTYVGKSGIVNIEKEARMSGQTHDKGVQIITGYLGQTYAQEFPLSLSCRICFEQNYNGIDGDSASSTELYCILSSLAEMPIRQDLAVTGSVNQKGEIQAIGGVNYKIEGFFDLCRKRGLTGTQGVIIPATNVVDLVLKEDVVKAVKEGQFHIYPITHIDEGIALLMGMEAGKKDKDGHFPADSIHGKVMNKLKKFYCAAEQLTQE